MVDGGLHVWDWLEQEGQGELLAEVTFKSIFPALLSDLCQFVFEGLSCSSRGKLTVSYGLLRKPLLENLYYLEWLAARPDEMLATFTTEGAEALDKHGSSGERQTVIAEALARVGLAETLGPATVEELRYGKSAESFSSLGNQAMHLVTTRNPNNTTEGQNFNFVFSDPEDIESQWRHLYGTLPGLLFYVAQLAELLMTVALREPMPDFEEAVAYRSLVFILSTDWLADHSEEALSDLSTSCPACERRDPVDLNLLLDIFYRGGSPCSECGTGLTAASVRAEQA